MSSTGVVITQLVVDASGAKTGVAEFEASMEKAKAAAKGAGEAGTTFDSSLRKWTQSLASTDPVLRAQISQQQALNRQMTINADAVRLGATNQAAAEAQLERVRLKYQGYIAAAEEGAAAQTMMGKATALLTTQLGPLIGLMSVGAVVAFSKSIFDGAAALNEQAEQAGVSTDALQAYRAILQQNGIDASGTDQILTRLTRSIGTARDVAGPARDAFNQMGISLDTLKGGAEETLPALAKALLAIHDQAQRSTLEVDLFGRSGQRLESALKVLADPASDVIEKGRAMGLVLGHDLTTAADDASDALSESWERLRTEGAPEIIEFTNLLVTLVKWYEKAEGYANGNHTVFNTGRFDPGTTSTAFPAGGLIGAPKGAPVLGTGAHAGATVTTASSDTYSTVALDAYIAKQRLSASIAGQGPAVQAQTNALVDAANIKLAAGAGLSLAQLDHFKNQDGTMRKFVVSTSEAVDVLGKGTAAEVKGLAATIARGAEWNKVKATFDSYLASLGEEARVAGDTAAQREDELAIVKAAQVAQKARGVEEKNLTQTLAGATKELGAQRTHQVEIEASLKRINALASQRAVDLAMATAGASAEVGDRELVLKNLQDEITAGGFINAQGKLEIDWRRVNREEIERTNREIKDGQDTTFISDYIAQQKQKVELINAEVDALGKSNVEQARALALVQAQQELKNKYGKDYNPGDPKQAAYLKAAQDFAGAQEIGKEKTDAYNSSLLTQRDLLSEIGQSASDAAAGMTGAFEKVGHAFGGAVSSYAKYQAQQEDFKIRQDAINKNDVKNANDQIILNQQKSDAEEQYYSDSIDGLKNMFGEKTAAYKVLNAIEGTYNALRLAGNIEAMISDAAAMAAKVATVPVHVAANETIAASGVAAGAGQIFAELGPWGFPVVAAMLAVMLGLGFSGGSGGSAPKVDTTAKDRQAAQGAGTVLGDATAKSDSISKSLDQMAKNTNADLEYSNQMVTSLRAIENSIGSLTSLLARQLQVGGAFDTSGLNLGTNGGGGGILGSLFGSSKTTTTLIDQGLRVDPTTIGEAVAAGIHADAYQTVQNTKSSSALFGLISSTKTSNNTTDTSLGSDFDTQVTGIISSLRTTVLDAATKLGAEGAQQVVDSLALNIGSVSFKDMTGAEIQDALSAVFSKVGDTIAQAAIPQLASLQKVGEGSLETLARVVTEYTAVDDAAKTVGFTFSKMGLDSLAARDHLVQLSGGLDVFTSQAQFFTQNFLTSAEQLAPIQTAVNNELARLGQSGVTTKDQFAALVQGLDTSTDAGAALYAALQNVAPAFAKVADAVADLADQRAAMEIQLLQATGDAAGATAAQRQKDIAAMDASLQPLQQQIYAAQDAAAAADALKTANDNLAAGEASLASQRADMQIALMQATGDATGALAAQRQKEIAALDASLVPLQNQIYAAQDAAAAADALKAANDNAAALDSQRAQLQITLMQATGDAAGALALQRAGEIAAMDASLVPLQQQIYAAQDAATANDNLATSIKAAADAAKATSDFNAGVADSILKITNPALATYNEMIATQAQRLTDAAAVGGDVNQVLWLNALENEQARNQAAFTDLGKNISALTDTASTAASAAQDVANSWGSAVDALSKASNALLISDQSLSPIDQYRNERSQFDQLRSAALGGDAQSASDIASFASDFLQKSFQFNGSTAAYGTDLSYVQSTLADITGFSKGQQSLAQRQADSMAQAVTLLGDIKDGIDNQTTETNERLETLTAKVDNLGAEVKQGNLNARVA